MLGSAIVRRLVDEGASVQVFDRVAYPDAAIKTIIGDVSDADAVAAAVQGAETVIHTIAAVSQASRPIPMMHTINVGGTQNVIAACQKHGVTRLIYTSSIDVVFDGTPIADGDETIPYPARHLDYYGTTKMLAEKAVLAANGVAGVATCALRTGGIFGPGDRYRFPSVVGSVVDSGRLTRLGDGKSKFGHVFVENAAHAHILAAKHLALNAPSAGQAYFVNDHAPTNFFDFFPPYLEALGVRYTESRVSYGTIRVIASFSDFMANLRPIPPDSIPPSGGLSRYAVESICKDFWFNHKKATLDLGYTPVVSEQEAFNRTLAWLRTWLAQRQAAAKTS